MNQKEFIAIESIDCLEPRSKRALTECMVVVEHAPDSDIYEVYSSDHSYTVDAREGRCTCPDHAKRGVKDKHQRRVEFATGERGVPANIHREDIDDVLLNRLTDKDHPARFGAPTSAVDIDTEANAEGKHIVTDGGNPMPTECEPVDGCDTCERLPLPCASCYVSGRAFNAVVGDEMGDNDD